MASIRWGIIGCGDVTEVKSGPGLQKAEGSALIAVMRRDSEKAADYARRHNVARWYDDAARLIADPDVDAVYIATPPGTHEYYALQVCAAGKPCYIEKPMTRNAAEALRIVDAFTAKDLPLCVAYYRRALPRFVKAREILTSGALGALQAVAYRYESVKPSADALPWRLQAEHAGGGLFLDLGSHALDILDFLLGPLTNVHGQAANNANLYDVEDQVSLTFTTQSNAIGTALWDFVGDRREDEFVFTGTHGELRLSCFGNEPLRVRYRDRTHQEFDLPNPAHVQQPLIQTIVDTLLGRRAEAPSTGVTALRTQLNMDYVLTKYYGGREDNFWTRPWPKC